MITGHQNYRIVRTRLVITTIILLASTIRLRVSAAATTDANVIATPPAQVFPPVTLRGYGELSGAAWNDASGSVLQINCQNPDKAKLVQAKYLSDLQVLPGVKEAAGKQAGGFTMYEVNGQGFIAAFCDDARVIVFSAKSKSDLQKRVQAVKPTGVSTSQTSVPMFLDRWDKFSFRHYDRPWSVPQGKTVSNYDFTGEFDYAEKEDRAGILVFNNALATDTAEEMLNSGWSDYISHEAEKRMLPVDLHIECSNGIDPIWILNRYRDQMQLKMPGFTGLPRTFISAGLGAQGNLSWNATTAEDDTLALLQTEVRRYASMPNFVSVLEPHNETDSRPANILMEYGPASDVNYRRYLKEQYGDLAKVAARWQKPLQSWDDVRVPELVSFAGWGPQALDIGGMWRVGYETLLPDPKDDGATRGTREAAPSVPAPKEWYQPSFDDSKWPQVPGGGDDTQLFLLKHPSVFRRNFSVSADWIKKNPSIWLYEWDMNQATHAEVITALNGQEIGRSKIVFVFPHWSAIDVTKVVKAGNNLLAIRVPQGRLEYKTYLSPVEPKSYPNLGEGLNAQWVDFTDFNQWARVQTIKHSMEMIRQAAPNQGITLMHPDEYSDGLKALAVAYGGEFHNTGYMGAFWADWNSSLMRGADLPYSIEPSSPAGNLQGWKHQWGLWQTEGVQAVDYFISIGSIIWNPGIKADYELHRKQFSLMGQSHFPKAETAVFYSDRIFSLTSFPWQNAYDVVLGGGYFKWNIGSLLRGQVPYDGLSQSSFHNGEADPYRVVVDSNTSIMDESMVADIEKWVRKGGTFITIAQTGRHTPELANAWPISRLTGYKVTHIDRIKSDGDVAESGTLVTASDQSIYGSAWNGVAANGLHLQKVASDTQDLLLWKDGSVAAGVRPLGKGYIVELGCKFTATGISDRIEPKGENDESRHLRALVMALLDWRKVTPEPAHLTTDNPEVLFRHGVTNNGVYDTWTMWNQSEDKPQTVSVAFVDNKSPAFSIDMRGAPIRRRRRKMYYRISPSLRWRRVSFSHPAMQSTKRPKHGLRCSEVGGAAQPRPTRNHTSSPLRV